MIVLIEASSFMLAYPAVFGVGLMFSFSVFTEPPSCLRLLTPVFCESPILIVKRYALDLQDAFRLQDDDFGIYWHAIDDRYQVQQLGCFSI